MKEKFAYSELVDMVCDVVVYQVCLPRMQDQAGGQIWVNQKDMGRILKQIERNAINKPRMVSDLSLKIDHILRSRLVEQFHDVSLQSIRNEQKPKSSQVETVFERDFVYFVIGSLLAEWQIYEIHKKKRRKGKPLNFRWQGVMNYIKPVQGEAAKATEVFKRKLNIE